MARLMNMVMAIALVALFYPVGARAQDPGEIARVQAGQSCPNCNLFQADLVAREIPGVDVSGSRLRQSDMSYVIMDRANFTGANLSVAEAFAGRFTRADFSGADLRDASFVGAYLGYANFSGAVFGGTYLAGANLEGAQNLTQAQLNNACGDADTILPPGLSVPYCR